MVAVELLADVAQALDRVGWRSARVDLDADDADHGHGVERHHLEGHELRLAAAALIDAPLDDHDAILLEMHARGDERLREHDDLDRARGVLELDERHRIALLRHRLADRGDEPADRDRLPLLALLEIADRQIDLARELVGDVAERMARHEDAERLALARQQLLLLELARGHRRVRAAAATADGGVVEALEEVRLAGVAIGLRLAPRLHGLVEHQQHPAARIARRIERARADQALQHAARHVLRVDALGDVPDRDEAPIGLARLDDRAHRVLADVLDGAEAEADPPVHHREVALRRVDVRRQHLEPHRLALGDVERHLVLGVHHRRDQRRHVLGRIVGLQVRGAVRDQRVAGGVRLVERVLRRALVLVPHVRRDLGVDAVGGAALDEARLERCHQLGVLLADRLAQVIRLGGAEARQLLGDEHRLLLVDVDAHRRGEDRLEPRIGERDGLLPVLTPRVGGNVLHRARAVQGHQGDEVLELRRLDLPQRVAHAGALELEDAGRVALAEHRVRRLVVERQVRDVDLDALRLRDQPHGLVDDVEVAQAEEVHLEQAERLDVAHRVLRDEFGVRALALQRHVLDERAVADHDGGGVDRVLAHEALERARHVDQLLGRDLASVVGASDRRGIVVHLAQLLAGLQALLEADLDAVGDALGDAVDGAVRQAEHSTGVARGLLGGQLAERDDLRDALAAVLVDDVVHHALAAVHREVDVDIGHGLAARVEEALEQQVVADRIDVGDLEAVRHERAGRRAAAGADADALALGEPDEVPGHEEVVREAHLADRRQLEGQPIAQVLRGGGIAAGEPLLAQAGEVRERVLPVRHLVLGQPDRPQLELDVAALRDLERRRQQVSAVRLEHPLHLVGRLEEELLVGELEALVVGQHITGLDAEQDLVRIGVLGTQVVHVAGADRGQAELVGQLDQHGVDLPVLVQVGILDLDVEVLPAEDLDHQIHLLAGGGLVALHDRLVDAARQAAAQRDQTARVLLEQVEVDARLVVVALEIAEGDELDEVVVPLEVLGEQREVRPVAAAGRLLRATILDEVDLAADDRLDAGLRRRAVEVDRPRHRAVVGDRDGRHLELRRALDELADAARTVEDRVLGVAVEVDELGRHGRPS